MILSTLLFSVGGGTVIPSAYFKSCFSKSLFKGPHNVHCISDAVFYIYLYIYIESCFQNEPCSKNVMVLNHNFRNTVRSTTFRFNYMTRWKQLWCDIHKNFFFCRIPLTHHNQLRRNRRHLVMLALESCRINLNWRL